MATGFISGRFIVVGALVVAAFAISTSACTSDSLPTDSTVTTVEPVAPAPASTTSTQAPTIEGAATGTPTTAAPVAALSADLAGPFPTDVTSPDLTIHMRTVITLEEQPLPIAFDFWWQESSHRYRLERRFGSSPVLAAAQVFTGTRWQGFVAAGPIRYAFDMSYEDSQKLNEVMDPMVVAGQDIGSALATRQLVETGALRAVGREESEGRILVRYHGTVPSDGGASSNGAAAGTREILVDEHTGFVVEESIVGQNRVLVEVSRDFEIIEGDEFERLMTLTIPPGYGPATAGGTPGQAKIYGTQGPEACAIALSDLSAWLPFPVYYLGADFLAPDGQRFVAQEVRTEAIAGGAPSLSLSVEGIGGLAANPTTPPVGSTIRYLSENQAKRINVVIQDPAFTPEESSYPLASWEKVRDLGTGEYTDVLYKVAGHFVYLAHRETAVIAIISDLDEAGVLAAGGALQQFDGAPSSLEDGTWDLQVDRVGGSEDPEKAFKLLPESNYHPIEDGPTYQVVISAQGTRVTVEGLRGVNHFVVKGTRTSTTDEPTWYELTDAPGGRFVVWQAAEGLQAELTLYGSGRPIISSERGTLVRVP